MLQSSNPDVKVNEIAMRLNANHNEVAIVMEGVDDLRIGATYRSPSAWFTCARGKITALEWATRAHERNIERAFFVIDRDFADFCSTPPPSPNVIVSDSHDCFMDVVHVSHSGLIQMICSKLPNSFYEDSSDDSPPSELYSLGNAAYEAAVKYALTLSAIRVEDCINGWNLNFNRFSPFVSLTADLDIRSSAKTILQSLGVPEDELDKRLERVLAQRDKLLENETKYIGDHDFLKILSWAMKSLYSVADKESGLRKGILSTLDFVTLNRVPWVKALTSRCEHFKCSPYVNNLHDARQ